MDFEFMVGDENIFTYDIYLVIYPTYFFVSKIYGIFSGLLVSGLVLVEVR